ncbi:hypothetical protein VTN00DRAFT_6139 [Thermoascus crustaceus]|uniref:uncharacterized protein n=1 Tax=Thermoascus crustaceus TaxID=5088 RepID=UPI00374436D5
MAYHPIVQELEHLLWEVDDLEQAVRNALKYNIPEMETYGITSATGFFDYANWLVTGWIPTESAKGRDIYYILCIFYFVLSQPPLGPRQTQINPKNVNKPLTPLSEWVVKFAKEVGSHLSKEGSINEASFLTFQNSPKYRVYEAEVPKGGFKTFNQFFCRSLKQPRPIAEPDNDRIVTFPADSTFAGAFHITDESVVELKALPWKVKDLLADAGEYADLFKNGVWMHTFLNTFDYHRQHAPVSGKVLVAKVIQGAAYLEVVVKQDEKGSRRLAPVRRIARSRRKEKMSPSGVYTVDAPDNPGYQFLQTRGLILIDNPKLGKVAVLPIGMAQVSSVVIKENLEGQDIKKGDEISHFEFGGSDCVMLFEEKARVSNFPDSDAGKHFFYGEKLATAHYKEEGATLAIHRPLDA